ncbi:MAG: sensor histidine kinase, partial [Candidatus Cloacimonetes bacterium]|nr:sensor histidine kinase [Candidatus Cloacimonadota bacterium]
GEFDERILIRTIKNAISRKMVEYELRDYREHIKLINKILRIDLVNHFAVIKSAINLFSDSEDKSYINDAYNNITKGVELINRISNSEVFKSKYKTLNTYFISDILQSIIEDYPSIEVNIEGNFQVFADDTIYSIFDNIISNALVHGKSEKIDIKMFKKDAICEIRVADDGIGIPDHIKYRIFEEGFKYGETAGSGLGLHIVKKALEKYGGCVYVEDNVPRGAVIVLQFILERRQKPRNDYFKK